MTRRDYQIIAEAIARAKSGLEYASTAPEELNRCLSIVVDSLAYRLQMENIRFDKDKFIAACGVDNE